ncbi:hypothetical protein RM545_15530 [Zunongwangia sp. F260]|uniref:Uncharacterized protein n=1 Tax=Autumnicola lenta TaxID=3075593 RepID=A0ABU3CP31_9FLAO|nr:hypothetical protein [Zunongwangia sp. F260]MDT0648105.1 hypothetical protein [Zunongwangia sp. F260]
MLILLTFDTSEKVKLYSEVIEVNNIIQHIAKATELMSWYLLYKAPSNWTKTQAERANILFESYLDIEHQLARLKIISIKTFKHF